MLQSKKALRVFWLFLFPVFLILAVYPPRISGYLNPYDEGLWLGAAQAILDGRTLYRDVFFHYGLVLAWYLEAAVKMLPNTVAALRGSFWVLNACSLLLIYGTLLRWVRNRYLRLGYATFFFCIPLAAHVLTIPMAGRYAAGFLPLFFWPKSEEDPSHGRAAFASGLGTALAIFISQEAGAAAFLANLYVFVLDGKEQRRRHGFLIGFAAGAVPVLSWLLGSHNFKAYMDCALVQTSGIVLRDSLPIPKFQIPEGFSWFVTGQILADSLALYVPAILYLAAWVSLSLGKFKNMKDRRLIAGLLIYGTAASVSAWVRPDRWHIYFALSPALFAWAVLADRLSSARTQIAVLLALALGFTLTFPHAKMSLYKDRHFMELSRKTTIKRLGRSRLPAVQAAGYEYLVGWVDLHVKPGVPFLFFPYDGCVYYLADRPNPTFYPVLVLANSMSLQDQVAQSLRKDPPEWAVWDKQDNVFDGQRIDVLMRPVCEFLAQHYSVRETIGPFLFLQHKTG